MLNQPMTSSSHWRIPKVEASLRSGRRAQGAQDWRRALAATFTQRGAQARMAARSASCAVFAGVLIGGVLVAPMLAIVALAALVVPPLLGLRHVAPALIVVALLWLAVSIFGAHTPVGDRMESETARRDRSPVESGRD